MAKIHIDCKDAILACEKAIDKADKGYNLTQENSIDEDPIETDTLQGALLASHARDSRMLRRHNQFRDHLNNRQSIEKLMNGAAYLKYKNRRLILDTQSEEFGLISNFLPKG